MQNASDNCEFYNCSNVSVTALCIYYLFNQKVKRALHGNLGYVHRCLYIERSMHDQRNYQMQTANKSIFNKHVCECAL